jgi:hypothetical protein
VGVALEVSFQSADGPPTQCHPEGLLVPKDLPAAALSLRAHFCSTPDRSQARDDAFHQRHLREVSGRCSVTTDDLL